MTNVELLGGGKFRLHGEPIIGITKEDLDKGIRVINSCYGGFHCRMAGPHFSTARQTAMEIFTGRKIPKSQCGVNALQIAAFDWAASMGADFTGSETRYKKVDMLSDWASSKRTPAMPEKVSAI